jgi:hypothetical protein
MSGMDHFYSLYGQMVEPPKGDPHDPLDRRHFLTGHAPTDAAIMSNPNWGIPSNGGVYGGAHPLAPSIADQIAAGRLRF